jgi:ankyrin repeat protein
MNDIHVALSCSESNHINSDKITYGNNTSYNNNSITYRSSPNSDGYITADDDDVVVVNDHIDHLLVSANIDTPIVKHNDDNSNNSYCNNNDDSNIIKDDVITITLNDCNQYDSNDIDNDNIMITTKYEYNNNINNNIDISNNSSKSLKGLDIELLDAIRDQNMTIIKDLLSSLPKLVKSVDDLGRTALHNACKLDNYEMVELLIQYNANYDAIDIMGKTCLHMTANPNIVCLLCEEGANVNIIDHQGFTPLHLFVMSNNKDCVKQIMLHNGIASIPGPDNLKNALHIAADNSNYDIISILINCSRHRLMLDMPDINGNTCLHLLTASEVPDGCQLKSILFLLDQGAAVTVTNRLGITALHYVCANTRYLSDNLAEPVVELLLHFKANPNALDADGCTPLIIACAHREWSICRLLIEAGADMNLPCPMDSYMLQYGDQNGKKISSKMGIFQDCTTTDLMPRGVRSTLFACISSYQTPIPSISRDRCMNCAALFQDDILSILKFSTGKHHCRYCNRLICQECSPKFISRDLMPSFITDINPESSLRACVVCYDILKDNS